VSVNNTLNGNQDKKKNFGERNFKCALLNKDIFSKKYTKGICYYGIKFKSRDDAEKDDDF
jgi:hypothetical protein